MEDGVTEEQTGTSLADLKKMFNEWQTLTQEGRNRSMIDIDYYDTKQLTADEKRVLSTRGQPDIVINRIKPAVNGILGVVERGKSEPRAYPRTPKDEESSDVATDTLRFIADFNRFPKLKIRSFKDMLVPGTMAAQVLVDRDLQVVIEQIRWEEFFYDPRSRREDFEDARYKGIAKWTYADDAKALYPDKADDIEAAVNSGPMDASAADPALQDRPNGGQVIWVDRKRRRLLIVEVYYREGQSWKRCVYHTNAILAEGDSPYKDDKGRPCCPIEAASAYVDRDNDRYGVVRDMVDVQDEINKRRSKALHYLNTRQVQEIEFGSGAGTEAEAKAEAAKPDGALPSGWQVVPQSDQVQGQLELLREAKSEIERLGPNPAILGREGTDSSGRALLARQQSGLVELAILFGLLEDWETRIYRQCWSRAKQYWTAPQWIRVTDDEGAPEFVGLNQPPTQPAVDPATGEPQMDPKTGKPAEQPGQYVGMMDPQTQQPAAEGQGKPAFRMPDGSTVLGYKNAVAEMDVDIILDSTPDTANVQQEQFQDLMQLVGSNPAYAQSVPFEIMLELSTVPHKRDLIDKLKKAREEAQAQQAQQMQRAQQIEEVTASATVRKDNAAASLNEAKADNERLKPEMDALQMGIDAHQTQGPPPGFQ